MSVDVPVKNPRLPLNRWLARVGALSLWTTRNQSMEFTIQAYQVNGQVLLVQDWGPNGWQIYIPSTKENDTARTLDAAAIFLGVEGCAGLLD